MRVCFLRPTGVIADFARLVFGRTSIPHVYAMLLVLGAFLTPTISYCQTSDGEVVDDGIGLKPFAAYHSGEFDNVNLSNGNLVLKIPLFSLPQRGSTPLSYSLYYNVRHFNTNKTTCNANGCSTMTVWGSPNNGGGVAVPNPTGVMLANDWNNQFILSPMQKSGCWLCDALSLQHHAGANCPNGEGDDGYQGTNYYYWYFRDATGANHTAAPVGNGLWQALDGSGLRGFTGLSQSAGRTVWDENGLFSSGICTLSDPNGNCQTSSSDTLGRPQPQQNATNDLSGCLGSATTTSAQTISVPAVNGGSDTYKLCYATLNVIASVVTSDANDPTYQSANGKFLQSVLLPNGTAWQFSYDASTGDLTQITLPLGGTISYQYLGSSFPQPDSVVARIVDAQDGSGPQRTTYQYVASTGYQTTTVTDPLQNDTITTLTSYGNTAYYPTQVVHYDGAASNGQVLSTETTAYQEQDFGGTLETQTTVLPTSRRITLPNGLISEKQFTYDSSLNYCTYTASNPPPDPYSNFCASYSSATSFGKVISESDTDWGQGSPGPVLRRVDTSYRALSGQNYLSYQTNNLLSLPYQITTYDASNNVASQTTYGYDESSLTPSGVTTQFNTNSPEGNARGNQTSVTRLASTPITSTTTCPASGSTVATQAIYFDTGEIQQHIDACNHATTYEYGLTYAGAFQTKSTNALGQPVSRTYDFNTGAVLSQTDANNNTVTFSYSDQLRTLNVLDKDHLTDVLYPDGGHAQLAYTANSVTISKVINATTTEQTLLTVDGLGRTRHRTVLSDPSGPVTVDTTYDGLGHVSSVSNPYRNTNEPTYGLTSYQYDGLGRKNLSIPPDGSTSSNNISYSNAGNSVMTKDQVGVSILRNTDALGRLAKVYETNVGWTTSYVYDVLGNLKCVEQQGGVTGTGCAADPSQDSSSPWRVRRFTYDSLSRLQTAKNPETGQTPTSYTYDANGNVITKTDGRALTTTYSYDVLDRLTGKTYSNNDPAVSYTYDANPPGSSGIGHRTGMSDASGSTTWTYEVAGRISSESKTVGTMSKTFSTTYYLDGSPYQLTYPSGNIVTYSMGADGLPLSVIDSAGNNYANSLVYMPAGALSSGTLGATNSFPGISLSNGYNNRLQPTLLQANTANATLMSFGYDFGIGVNDNGNLNNLINYKDSNRNLTFSYDRVNRLAAARVTAVQPGSAATASLVIGSELSKCPPDPSSGISPPRCTTKIYDSGNVYLTVGGVAENTYYGQGDTPTTVSSRLAAAINADNNSVVTAVGNGGSLSGRITLTSKTVGSAENGITVQYIVQSDDSDDFNGGSFGPSSSTTLSGGSDSTIAPGQLNETYSIDAWGNMVPSGTYAPIFPMSTGPDNRVTGYYYDNAGNLLSDGTAGVCANNMEYGWNAENQLTCFQSYSYLYDGDGNRVEKVGSTMYWGQLAESDTNGNLTSEYVFLNGERIARRDVGNGAVFYYLSDNLGSSNVVTDATGAIQNESDFYPFGTEKQVTNNLANQHYKYTGKIRDDESGLDYFGARYYGSSMGRFMSPDWSAKFEPIPYSKLDDPQTFNLYAYVRNNPLSNTDKDGHCSDWTCNAAESYAGKGGNAGEDKTATEELQDAARRASNDDLNSPPAQQQGASSSQSQSNASRAQTQLLFAIPYITKQLGVSYETAYNNLSLALTPDGQPIVIGGHANFVYSDMATVQRALDNANEGGDYKNGSGDKFARLGSTPSTHLDKVDVKFGHGNDGLIHLDRFNGGNPKYTLQHFGYDVVLGHIYGSTPMLPY